MSFGLFAFGVPTTGWMGAFRHVLILTIILTSAVIVGTTAPLLVDTVWDVPKEELRNNVRGVLMGVISAITQGWHLWLLVWFGCTVGLYVAIDKPFDRVEINFHKMTNGLVYLYSLTYFLYVFRPGIVAVLLVWAILMAPGIMAPGWSSRRFRWVLLAFAAFFAAGFLRAAFGFDTVRTRLPLDGILNGGLPLFHGLLVFYVVRRNGWGVKEFERFFKYLLIMGTIVALEAITVFYLDLWSGLELFGMNTIAPSGLFQSAFVGNYHAAGRIGIVVMFMSIYFYSRSRNMGFILTGVLGGLLLFSTLLQQVILSSIFGLLVAFILARRGLARRSRSAIGINAILLPLLAVVALSSILIFSNLATSIRGDSLTGIGGYFERPLFLARGLDTFLYTYGLGTGPGILPQYMGAQEIPMTASEWILPLMGSNREELFAVAMRGGELGTQSYTLHNLWFEFIYEWGILGLLIIVYVVYRGWILYRVASDAEAFGPNGRDMTNFWIIFGMACAISLSMLFTSKFAPMEFFVMLFLFLEASTLQDRLQKNEEKEEALTIGHGFS